MTSPTGPADGPADGLRAPCAVRSGAKSQASQPLLAAQNSPGGTLHQPHGPLIYRAWACSLSDSGTETSPVGCRFSRTSFPVFLAFAFLTFFMAPPLSRQNRECSPTGSPPHCQLLALSFVVLCTHICIFLFVIFTS